MRFTSTILIAASIHAGLFCWVQTETRPPILPLAQAEVSIQFSPSASAVQFDAPSAAKAPAAAVKVPPRIEDTPRPVKTQPSQAMVKLEIAPPVPEADFPVQVEPAPVPPREVAESITSPPREAVEKTTPPGGTPGQNRPQGVRMAAVVGNQKPIYPPAAERRGHEGLVGVWVRVTAEGHVLDATLDQSSGYPILDEHTVRFARTLRFIPARRGATPVAYDYYYSVRYSIER